MKEKTKNALSIAYVLATVVLVVALGMIMGDMRSAWDAILRLHPGWALGAFGCWAAYAGIRAYALIFFCKRQGLRLRPISALRVAILGQYYAGITPASTGGQPMQVYEMSRSGVPVGVATSVVLVKTLFFQFTLVGLGIGLGACYAKEIAARISGLIWFVALGLAVNLLWSVALVVVVFSQPLLNWLIKTALRLGVKLRWIRAPERFEARTRAQLAEFRRVTHMLREQPAVLGGMLALAALQVLVHMSTVYFLYRGFGYQEQPYGFLLAIQTLLFVSVSFMPTPGGSGAQEGGFFLFFRGIFPEGTVLPALLCWRFLTYYLTLLVGAVVVIRTTLRNRRR